jgi:protein-S-isoprenylcysteine O-methyltransferase Ste14
MTPEHTIYVLWGAWPVSWMVAMAWSNQTEKRDAIAAELLFRLLFYASVILLFSFPPSHHHYAQTRLWQFGDMMSWVLVTLTAAALLFTWWARIHLGRLWSDWVAKKAGHHAVDTGPYRRVRHPIFSGLILAALATAIQKGIGFALLGGSVITLGPLRQSATGGTFPAYRTRRRCL